MQHTGIRTFTYLRNQLIWGIQREKWVWHSARGERVRIRPYETARTWRWLQSGSCYHSLRFKLHGYRGPNSGWDQVRPKIVELDRAYYIYISEGPSLQWCWLWRRGRILASSPKICRIQRLSQEDEVYRWALSDLGRLQCRDNPKLVGSVWAMQQNCPRQQLQEWGRNLTMVEKEVYLCVWKWEKVHSTRTRCWQTCFKPLHHLAVTHFTDS